MHKTNGPVQVKVTGITLKRAYGCIVFVWYRDSLPLYVGKSNSGLKRFLDQREVLDTDEIEIIACDTEEECDKVAQELVMKYRPGLNARKRRPKPLIKELEPGIRCP